MSFDASESVFTRLVPSASMAILLLACVSPLYECVGAYMRMENDRILLMNNDSKWGAAVTFQGYYNTNTNDKTYWVHDSTSPGFSPNLLRGITHTMYRKDGTRLWHLDNCRAGSGTVINNMRNYIPWSTTAKSITNENGTASIAADAAGVKGVGSVIFRNTASACLYSPYYEEGIGTIYWDCVNAFVNHTDGQIALEIATDVTPSARDAGITFASVTDNYDDLDWRPCPFNVFTVENASGPPIPLAEAVTNMTLSSTATGSNLFYRARTQLNYYGPIRFRIRRLNDTGGNLDTTALILLDNIIASYPPMTARLHRHGKDYDSSLRGSDVLGCVGDFSEPFQAFKSEASLPLAWFEFVTNTAALTQARILNPQLHYRWRYLNQIVGPWKTIPFDQTSISSTSVTTSNLVGQTGLSLTDGVGDIEYYYTAEIDAPYYAVRDYAFATPAGYGEGWTEAITAITNRATYTAVDGVPSGGTDYFTRIREGESNIEWVELPGTLTVANAGTGGNEVMQILTPDGAVPRMTLVGDHTWCYHYPIPKNAIGGELSFKLVTKGYYTNATDATTWHIRTNELFTVEDTVTEIPHAAKLDPANPNEISVILDDASTHLKIEYNDAQHTFSLSHASYQDFNLWTEATEGYRGMAGGSDSRCRYDLLVDEWTTSGELNSLWKQDFDDPSMNILPDAWFPVQTTPNGWTAYNGRFVENTRADSSNLALALDGLGEGALALEDISKDDLPLGLDSVEFTARLAQPIRYEDFATYMDGLSCTNYAISAMVTMSGMYEDAMHTPTDMSPVNPSVSFVGYHRGKQGCYEFRMTRTSDTVLTLELYKWERTGSGTKPLLLTSKNYTANMLVAKSTSELDAFKRTAAYFLVYTLSDGIVKLEGHLSSVRTQKGAGIVGSETGLAASSIAYVDGNPGVLARGGSYGVGSIDCRADFGGIRIHSVATAPSSSTATSGDARISIPGVLEGRERLLEEWDYSTSRWEVDSEAYDPNGGLSGVVPSNQEIQVWLSDAAYSGSRWGYSGYSVVVDSFSTNRFTVSPRMAGSWKVRLQTGQEEDAGVVLDDVKITPWEGENRWGRNGSVYGYSDEWVYTKAWVTPPATIMRNGQAYALPDENIQSVGANGNVFIFNEPGYYTFVPTTDMVIDRALLVGGGGAGGWTVGGGGGGGGVLDYDWSDAPVTIPAGSIMTISVGAGGDNYFVDNSSNANWKSGGNGEASSLGISSSAISIMARGGGGGGCWGQSGMTGNQQNGKTGGSGGGSAQNNATQAAGTDGQGFHGGRANVESPGGGGGAGGPGGDGTGTSDGKSVSGNNTRNPANGYASDGVAGAGGTGKASDITGRIEYYGGGGGGGSGCSCHFAGNGGIGGGGMGGHGGGNGIGAFTSMDQASCGENGMDGRGGGGGGGGFSRPQAGGRGGCGTVILRVRTAPRQCVLQPSRGKEGYPMGIRTPYIGEGMSLFTYSYANADSNCVLLVQIATNMAPSVGTAYVPGLTESIATNGDDVVWTTIARHDFSTMSASERASGSKTAFIGLRQHQIYDSGAHGLVNTNVCGLIRVIVDPAIVSQVVTASREERDALVDYGKITITKTHFYNEPLLDSQSWFGWNIHTEGWDGAGGAGRFAYLPDWPAGLSCSLNFSARVEDNNPSRPETLGIGLGEPDKATEYAAQNPFVQSAVLTNGIGSVSFRARLFDTNAPGGCAVVTLYGGMDPAADQPITESQFWHILTNFVVTTPTYQAFEWIPPAAQSPYQAIRLEMAGARWGRYPSLMAAAWEWDDLDVRQTPINRVFIDDVSVSEVVVPRVKFCDVRPFRNPMGRTGAIPDILSFDCQPLIGDSWGVQARITVLPDDGRVDRDSIRVFLRYHLGADPWGYARWKDGAASGAELTCVDRENLIFRSTDMSPGSVIAPIYETNTVVQYSVVASYRQKDNDVVFEVPLTSDDWSLPPWYGTNDLNQTRGDGTPGTFSAYTILQASLSDYEGSQFVSVPDVVTGLVADGSSLTWDALPNATTYLIYRATSGDVGSAKLLGSSTSNSYVDTTGTLGRTYWYWVVAANPSGRGEWSASANTVWTTPPLSVATSELPLAMEMVEYNAQLLATGGTEPYTWDAVASDYSMTRPANTFSEVGVEQGWDDYTWETNSYALPFAFPFYGKDYSSVHVGDNGTLSFERHFTSTSSYGGIRDMTNNTAIGVLWDSYSSPMKMFVDETSEHVTFRWQSYGWYSSTNCNFSVTLYSNGCIRLSYGAGKSTYSAAGLSAGDGKRYLEIGRRGNGVGNNASDVLLTPCYVESAVLMPPGLSVTAAGLLHGTMDTAFTNNLAFRVTDAADNTAIRELALAVAANPNKRPVIESVSPTNAVAFVKVGDSRTFSMAASDPEGETLSYRWTMDGQDIANANVANYTFSPGEEDAGTVHDLTCLVSDGLWSGKVSHAWQIKVPRTIYVDAASTNDEWDVDGSSPESAYRSIDGALRYAELGDTILVAPGVYDGYAVFGANGIGYGEPEAFITIKSSAGPQATVVKGSVCNQYGGWYREDWARYYGGGGYENLPLPVLEGFTICCSGVRGVSLVNCMISGVAEGESMYVFGCRLVDCIVTGCRSRDSLLESCELTRCTVAGNTVSGDCYALDSGSLVVDSIVYGNATEAGEPANYNPRVEFWYDWTEDGDRVEVSIPYVVITNSCTWPMPTMAGSGRNISDNPRLVDAENGDLRLRVGSPCIVDGVQTMGAHLGEPVAGSVVTVRVEGHGAVSPAQAIVEGVGDATFEVVDFSRRFLGFYTNGVFATADTTLVWRNIAEDGIVNAVFSNYTFYVDAATGDDGNDGLSWACAKASLQAAVGEAVDGETVYVKAGTYGPVNSDGKRIRIESVAGKDSTFIDGGGTNRCATLGSTTNTLVRGFTLTNGRANQGGGACYGTLEDCDIVGNVATNDGGGLYYSTARRCRIVGNRVGISTSYPCGGGSYYGTLISCLVAGNSAIRDESFSWGGGEGGGTCYGKHYNCTIVSNSVSGVGCEGGGAYSGTLYNSIVYGNLATNLPNEVGWSSLTYTCRVGEDPRFADGDYRLSAESPCVNAGSNDYVDDALDLDGNRRILGGTVDIGAYENQGVLPLIMATAGNASYYNGTYSYDEGDTAEISFELEMPFGAADVGYIFLLPLDEASSNLVQTTVFSQGLSVMRGATAPNMTARLSLLDGKRDTVLRYRVELWDTPDRTGSRIAGYVCGDIQIRVYNCAPSILTDVNADAIPATIGVPVRIVWRATDVLADVTNGMTVTWRTSEGFSTSVPITNATSNVFGGTHEIVFTSVGEKVVSMTIQDKDGASVWYDYYFDVQVPPVEITVRFGGQPQKVSADWVGRMTGLPAEWVESHQSTARSFLESTAANGRLSVVECYALGLDPEVATDDLVITELPMKANGTPDLANLKYEPSADKWNLPGIAARILGAPDLAGPWQEVQEGGETSLRFFKIVIVVQ